MAERAPADDRAHRSHHGRLPLRRPVEPAPDLAVHRFETALMHDRTQA
jgi:hypothetical protein